MDEITDKTERSFSLQKIPFNTTKDNEDDINTDKVKILELCNVVDKWEKEVLFSDNGFYSLKGKEVQDKTNEFINELSDFMSVKLHESSFSQQESKKIAMQIKNEKIAAILNKMKIYERQELNNWAEEVYNESISSCIQRAVLYKEDTDVIEKSYRNAMSVIDNMAEKEDWNSLTYHSKVKEFKSDFYYSIIKSFMADKNINACKYFSKYKKDLMIDDSDSLEKSLEQLKINIIAYNWAKELFSYNLEKGEQEKYINKIDDSETEKVVRSYLNDFSLTEEKQKREKEISDKEQNWQEIITAFEENPNNTFVYIDYTLPQEHINAVKKYINKMKKDGYIKTDKSEFIKLIKEFFEDLYEFKEKDISHFRSCLAPEDFDILQKFRSISYEEFENYYSDYQYTLQLLSEKEITSNEEKYDFIKLFLTEIDKYKKNNNNKIPDLSVRNGIINTVSSRFLKQKNHKNEERKDK